MIKSVDRALDVLEYMSIRRDVSVTEIATEFELDKATVSRMMRTFEKHGMVVKSDLNAKYCVGSGVLRLSYNISQSNQMVREARPALKELASRLDTTVRLCLIEGKRVFIIDQVERHSSRASKDADIPGISKPLYCSAIGKCVLAHMPPSKLNALLNALELTAYTENTITDKDRLKEELQQVRQQGYALNLAEFSDRSYCIAVPIFCKKGSGLRYCIGITGQRDYRADEKGFAETIDFMKRISRKITLNMNEEDV